jgi:predicted dehydrogenase
MTRQFSVGVIGAGFIGPAHIEGLRRLGHHVAAVAEATQELADRAAGQLHVERAYGDWRRLIDDPAVEVVHIASPNHLHFAQASAALQAGKPVICEKPLAMDSRQSAELVTLARSSGVVHAVNFNLRFYPLVQEARARIRRGDLGERLFSLHGGYLQDWLLLETDWNWRLDPGAGGEFRALADIGSHWLDLAMDLTGRRITAVCAEARTFHPTRFRPRAKVDTFAGSAGASEATDPMAITTEDYAALLLRFEGDAVGSVVISQAASGRKNRLFIEVNGSRSSLAWDGERPNELWLGHRQAPNEVLLKDPSLMDAGARWSASYPGGHAEGFPDTFKQLQQRVYQAIEAGPPPAVPDYPTFVDGHRVLLVTDAIRDSLRRGAWAPVDLPPSGD